MEVPCAVTWIPPNHSKIIGNDELERGDCGTLADPGAGAGMTIREACTQIPMRYFVDDIKGLW